jgi:hypothetical protein
MVGKKEGNELELAISVVNPSASDKADGIVKIDIKGGNAPYHITIETNTRTSSINAETDGHYELKNVSKGFYFLFVRDGQGNHVTKNINI